MIVIAAAAMIIILYSLQGGPSSEEYAKEIRKERDEKNLNMKADADLPFGKEGENFKGLHYFDPDLKFKIIAELIPIENKKIRTLSTSDGKEKTYQEYAFAEFELDGVKNSVLILEFIQSGAYRGTLFLPFADETSAAETYGAGRYLDLKKTPGSSTITLDFNKAYNPYCAYSDNFSCPFPPQENILKVAIKAGEKSYH